MDGVELICGCCRGHTRASTEARVSPRCKRGGWCRCVDVCTYNAWTFPRFLFTLMHILYSPFMVAHRVIVVCSGWLRSSKSGRSFSSSRLTGVVSLYRRGPLMLILQPFHTPKIPNAYRCLLYPDPSSLLPIFRRRKRGYRMSSSDSLS